jgi:aspartyl/glutamyl-tRNA(Asn/Gln) amidotransferase C subunit
MKVTEKDVAYVADLANLELTGEERTGMVRDLNSILHYIERLSELDTSNVEPTPQNRRRRYRTATASTNPSRAARDSHTRVAKM